MRNQLRGTRARDHRRTRGGDLIDVDVGGVTLLARITAAATRELPLAPGSRVWVLVKAV